MNRRERTARYGIEPQVKGNHQDLKEGGNAKGGGGGGKYEKLQEINVGGAIC